MEWNPEYSLGIEVIDEQHKALVEKIAEIEELVKIKSDWMATHYALDELTQIARLHLSFEEGIMRLFELSAYEEHKKMHDHFLSKITEIENHALLGVVGTELILFLNNWILEHILVADRRDYGEIILGVKQTIANPDQVWPGADS